MNKLRCYLFKPNKVETEKEDEISEECTSYQPRRERKCQDTAFLIVYLLLIGLLTFLASYSFQNCYISYFWHGTDSWGNVCGGDSGTLTKIDTVEGSGVMRSEGIYVWTTLILSSSCDGHIPIRLCVMECPIPTTTNETSKMCSRILTENDYRSATRTVTMKQCELIEHCLNKKQG